MVNGWNVHVSDGFRKETYGSSEVALCELVVQVPEASAFEGVLLWVVMRSMLDCSRYLLTWTLLRW